LEGLLAARRGRTGRPAKDRAGLATAFLAKALLNLPTTRDLIDRLRADATLRQLCGWSYADALPHESKFSRAFAEFAASELPQQLHEAAVAATQQQRLIGHIARDSTAIPVRERFPETAAQKKQKQKKKRTGKKRKSGRPHGRPFARAKASERGTRIQRQRHQKLDVMLADLPRQCDLGVKTNSKGHKQYWRGTKKPSQLPKIFPPEPTPELNWAQKDRFKERSMVERVNGRLKDEFGASQIRVRGAVKVMAHLMFGVLALTVDQWLRLIEYQA